MNVWLAQVSVSLVSIAKPLLMFVTFIPWAWLISAKLDKDARYYHMNYHMWNGIHLGAGVAALLAILLVPIFWVGWPISLLLLAAPILAYWKIRNGIVPEGQQFYLTSQSLADRLSARKASKAVRTAAITFIDANRKTRPVPVKEDPLYPTHLLAEDLLGPAVAARASRLEVTVTPNGATAAQTVDGVKYKRESMPADAAAKLVDYLKDAAALDVQDRRKRQVGTFKMTSGELRSDITITTEGSSTGLRMRLDFDREQRLSKPFDGIGLLESQMESLKSLTEIHDRHGIVLLGAPPGHGLTTTAYSFLSRHDAYTSNIKTLEREIHLYLDGVDQVLWDAANPDIDFATNLQSILRRDPDVVMISELQDSETALAATQPGMEGPLLYIQMRSPSIPDTFREWAKRVGDARQATKALRVITNQRLIRTLCPHCRQAYQPTPEQLKRLNLSGKVSQLYRASGKVQVKNKIENCPVCQGTGYLGQTAAMEIFIVDDESRKLLATGDLKGAVAAARRKKMLFLQEAALAKVVAGETTIEEVIRVTARGDGSEAPPAPSTTPTSGAGEPPRPQPSPKART